MEKEESQNEEIEKLIKLKNIDGVVHIKDAATVDGEYTTPYSLGYPIFDDVLMGGVREGDLVIGTGLSGQGKTTYFQNISANMSDNKLSCLWFSYEVIIDNLYAKFKAMGCSEKDFLAYTPKQLTSGNVEWIHKKIIEGSEKYGTKFVFIDHIDFLTPRKIRSTDQKRMILRDICTQLKQIAIGQKVVIFLIAHVKKVQGRAIEMQDISESSSIYQLADFVFAVERNVETVDLGGKKAEIYTEGGRVRILKNRLTGETPFMNFRLENDIIMPIGLDPIETNDVSGDVIVAAEEKKERPLFGDKN